MSGAFLSELLCEFLYFLICYYLHSWFSLSFSPSPCKLFLPLPSQTIQNIVVCSLADVRNLTVADDMILVQLSSAQENTTQEEKDAYVAGLKTVIQDMRVKKVKDFNTVASEIAAYRPRFRGDSSRILPL